MVEVPLVVAVIGWFFTVTLLTAAGLFVGLGMLMFFLQGDYRDRD